LAATALATACASSAPASDAASTGIIRPSAIEAHIRYLASDLMEGREAGTRGYDLAAAYVASQFQLLGLRPASGDSYFQQVPLQSHWLIRDGVRMTVRPTAGGTARQLKLGDDFIVGSSPLHSSSRVSAPAVFAGYGIQAPPFTHDDYDGLDVTGKVVVVLSGYPVAFPSEEGAHYGSGREKAKTAAARGAIGLVTIYTERQEKVSPWDRAVSTIDQMSMSWIDPTGMPFTAAPEMQITAVMSPAGGAALFDGAPRSYQDVRTEAAKGAPKGFPLAVSVEIAQASKHERRQSANVAAILEGSDPTLRDEYVVLVGHLDHEGIGTPVKGDALYNGALDNAAGIAAMLEAARALVAEPVKPKRSILFLAVTAEEKGLLGSEYFAINPTVPRDRIVGVVNLDMPILLYDFTDVIAFGAQHSSLQGVAQAALQEAGLTLTPDPMPEQSIFVRSDHYRFVQQGIPAIMLSTGWNSTKGEGEGGKVFQNFLTTHYHRPSDDTNLPIDYAAGARFAHVNYVILKAIANDANRPAWNEGDFFGDLFGR
jgi:Zn-dependent M28 family amino/carboxypeptidase